MGSSIATSTDSSWLPAFVVGYELQRGPTPLPDRPDWLVALEHQFLGHANCQRHMAGAVMTLHSNTDNSSPRSWLLARALQEMGEFWTGDNAEEAQELRSSLMSLVHYGQGCDMREPDLAEMSVLMTQCLEHIGMQPSAIKRGAEGILEFEVWTAVANFFHDWRLTIPRKNCDEQVDRSANYSVGNRFSDHHLATLRRFGTAIGQDEEPTVFLLWENSD